MSTHRFFVIFHRRFDHAKVMTIGGQHDQDAHRGTYAGRLRDRVERDVAELKDEHPQLFERTAINHRMPDMTTLVPAHIIGAWADWRDDVVDVKLEPVNDWDVMHSHRTYTAIVETVLT